MLSVSRSKQFGLISLVVGAFLLLGGCSNQPTAETSSGASAAAASTTAEAGVLSGTEDDWTDAVCNKTQTEGVSFGKNQADPGHVDTVVCLSNYPDSQNVFMDVYLSEDDMIASDQFQFERGCYAFGGDGAYEYFFRMNTTSDCNAALTPLRKFGFDYVVK